MLPHLHLHLHLLLLLLRHPSHRVHYGLPVHPHTTRHDPWLHPWHPMRPRLPHHRLRLHASDGLHVRPSESGHALELARSEPGHVRRTRASSGVQRGSVGVLAHIHRATAWLHTEGVVRIGGAWLTAHESETGVAALGVLEEGHVVRHGLLALLWLRLHVLLAHEAGVHVGDASTKHVGMRDVHDETSEKFTDARAKTRCRMQEADHSETQRLAADKTRAPRKTTAEGFKASRTSRTSRTTESEEGKVESRCGRRTHTLERRHCFHATSPSPAPMTPHSFPTLPSFPLVLVYS